MKDVTEYYNFLIDEGIATEQELNLVTSINGYNIETLDDVLYVRTGYRDYEQYIGEDKEEDEEDEEDEEEDDE